MKNWCIQFYSTWLLLSHFYRFLRLAMASIMDILKIKPFVEVSVGQLLWGYEDPLLKLAKDVVPKEQKLPYEEFGVLYGKNSTSPVCIKINLSWWFRWYLVALSQPLFGYKNKKKFMFLNEKIPKLFNSLKRLQDGFFSRYFGATLNDDNNISCFFIDLCRTVWQFFQV